MKNIREEIVKDFGDAHESETPSAFSLEVQMDLYNNYVGREVIGRYNKFESNETISSKILQQLGFGNLKYLSPINYSDPCYWGCSANSLGNHGISSNTPLIPTDE